MEKRLFITFSIVPSSEYYFGLKLCAIILYSRRTSSMRLAIVSSLAHVAVEYEVSFYSVSVLTATLQLLMTATKFCPVLKRKGLL